MFETHNETARQTASNVKVKFKDKQKSCGTSWFTAHIVGETLSIYFERCNERHGYIV